MHDKELFMAIFDISHLHRKISTGALHGQGITRGMPNILHYLRDNDGCIQRDLAENCRVRPATISSVLDNMEQSGYIERRYEKDDRRVSRIFLTEPGREKMKLVEQTFGEVDDKCLKGVKNEEKELALAVLLKILNNMYENREENV